MPLGRSKDNNVEDPALQYKRHIDSNFYTDKFMQNIKWNTSRKLLMNYMNALPYSFHLYDSNLYLIDVNRQAQGLTGLTREYIGRHITELSPNIKESSRYEAYLNVLQSGNPFYVDTKLPLGVNGEIDVAIRAFKIGDGLGLLIRDISKRKERERKLEKAEKSYRNLLEGSNDAVLVFHGPVIAYANSKAADYVGLDSGGELKGNQFIDYVAPGDKEKLLKLAKDRMMGYEVPESFELTLLKKDGGTTIVEAKVSYTEFEGKPSIISFARDITERKKTELELKKSSSELQEKVKELTFLFKALKSINDIVTIEELGPELVEMLPSAMKHTGEAVPYIQIDDRIFVGSGYSPGMQNILEAQIKTDNGLVGKVAVYYPDGYEFMLPDEQNMLDALSDSLGSWYDGVNASNAFIQYTENLQEEVEEKSKDLIDAERMAAAGRIAAMVAHDLRTPLQTIRSAVHLIRNQRELTDEMLDLIDTSVNRASNMIEEFRSQTRDTPLKREPVLLSNLVKMCADEAIIPRSINLEIVIDDYEPRILADPSKIRRVLDNMVSNAVDAMPDTGKLCIEMYHTEKQVTIQVSDTGIGISKDNMENLFKPFHTTKDTGLGLGLPFCKRTVEAHGGVITCESKLGIGTTFKITLPITGLQDYELIDLDQTRIEADIQRLSTSNR